jgi:predicted CxxxxCH...CXXCH cytochrome family protein
MTWHERAHLKDRRGAGLPASVLVAALVASAPAWADAPPGAASCSGCHGPTTLGTAIPSLEGHSAADIVAQMQAFRTSQRPATVMGRIAKGFPADETRAIAEWLANPEAERHDEP